MKRFLPLLLLPLLLLSGCKVAHDTEFLPTQAQEEQSVWISQEPLAFLTRAQGIRGGLLLLDGTLRPVLASRDETIFGMALGDLETVTFEDGETWGQKLGEVSFADAVETWGKPISHFGWDYVEYVSQAPLRYTEDGMTLSPSRRSPEFPRETLTLTNYDKSAVSPADFGFPLADWDDFPDYPLLRQAVFEELPLRTDGKSLATRFPWPELTDARWKAEEREDGSAAVCGWFALPEETLARWQRRWDWQPCAITPLLPPEDGAEPGLSCSPAFQRKTASRLTDAAVRFCPDFSRGRVYFSGVFLPPP